MVEWHFDAALLPDGWAREVSITVTDGFVTRVRKGAPSEGCERIGGVALPGLPNVHSHTFQRGMAGLAETRGSPSDSFWTWRRVMYDFLEVLTPDDVEAIAAFAMMEMLEGGFTALAEFHYLHHAPGGQPYDDIATLGERIVAAARETGMGLTLLPVLYAHGGFGGQPISDGQRRFANDIDRYLRLLEASRNAISHLDDGRLGVAPHSLRAVTPEMLDILREAEPEALIHIHIAEQMKEVRDCVEWSGRRPVEWLLDRVPVDARWCLVHATHLEQHEIRLIAQSGAIAGLCPLTEANLGDGTFPAADYAAAAGRWGVGSDSNIEISAPGELKQLEYSQRLTLQARNVLAAGEGCSTGRAIYEAALAGGSQALGRSIGAIEAGRRADLVVLDADHPGMAAASEDRWLDTYIFSLGNTAIRDVFVGGRHVVAGGRHHERSAISDRYVKTMRRLAGR